MKNIIALSAVLALAGLYGCGGQQPEGNSTEQAVEAPAPSLNTAPYTVSLQNATSLAFDSLQSYAIGEWNGYWLIVGGRTKGFHGTGGPGRTFPSQYANDSILVFQPSTSSRWSVVLPAAYYAQLSSTNMEYYQDGNTLWLAGGYGCTNKTNKAPCYQTYPNLTAVNLSGIIGAITSNNTGNLTQYLSGITDSRFQVTGGALRKIASTFYLVMGQNYNTIYSDGVTGAYTEQIRTFNLALSGNAITVSNYSTISDPSFHRRDLNIVEAVRPGGAVGINVFGGVFTPNSQQGGPWVHPIRIDQSAGTTTWTPDTLTQNFNLYDCAHVLLYDSNHGSMYTTLFGGITNLVLDASGNPVPSAGFMPFSQYISTIVQYNNSSSAEFAQKSPLLPGFIGAVADMIVNPAMPIVAGTSEVIDFAQLPSGDNLVGWIYGGIISTAEQTNAVSNPSFASATIYEVHITK